jgi:hypothetical protein
MKSKGDGFPQRFLLCAPKPVFFTIQQMKAVAQPEMALSVVFLIIIQMNKTPVAYDFDDEAQNLYENCFDDNQSVIQANLQNHMVKYVIFKLFCYLITGCFTKIQCSSSIFGKCNGQLLRLSCIVHVLRKAFDISQLLDATETSCISADLIVAIDNLIHQQIHQNIISVDSVRAAVLLLQFFNMHKLNFAGFRIGKTIVETISMFPQAKETIPKKLSASEEICQRILLFPGNIVAPMFLNKFRRLSKDDTLQCFEILEGVGLGVCHEYKPKTGLANQILEKKTDPCNINHVSALAKYAISIRQYLESFTLTIREHEDYKGSKSALGKPLKFILNQLKSTLTFNSFHRCN